MGVGGEGMAMLSRAGERLSWQRWFHQPGVVESSAMPLMGEEWDLLQPQQSHSSGIPYNPVRPYKTL